MEKKDLENELNALNEKYNTILGLLEVCNNQRLCISFELLLRDVYMEMSLLRRLIVSYFSAENSPEQGEDKK